MKGAIVALWGGPEDGADLYLPPVPTERLPDRVGVHRTRRGELIPVGANVLQWDVCSDWPVYERVTGGPGSGRPRSLFDGRDRPLYVHAPVVDHWRASGAT